MNIINILTYLCIGFLWTEWLEWFCMKTFTGKLGRPFTFKEKALQFTFWPIFVAVFIYNFLKDLINRS